MNWTDVKIPKEFVALVAKGDRLHALHLWQEPMPALGYLTPEQLWNRPDAGPLELTVLRQDIVRVLATGFIPTPTFGEDLPFAPVPDTVRPTSRPDPGRVNGDFFRRKRRRARTLPAYRD